MPHDSQKLADIISRCINEEIQQQPKQLQEFAEGISKTLKIAGGVVIGYYVLKHLIHQMLTDDKFVNVFSKKVADRLETLEVKAAERERRQIKHKV